MFHSSFSFIAIVMMGGGGWGLRKKLNGAQNGYSRRGLLTIASKNPSQY